MSRSGWEVVGVLAGIAGVAGAIAIGARRAQAHAARGDRFGSPPDPATAPADGRARTSPDPIMPPPDASPPPTPIIPMAPGVEVWRSYVRALSPAFGVTLNGPAIPENFVMKWNAMEADGQVCAVGFPGELDAQGRVLESGLGQFMSPHDIALAGTTVDEMRAACSTEVRFPGLTRRSPPAEIAAARAKAQHQVRPLTEAEKYRQILALLTFIAGIRRIVDASFHQLGVRWPAASADYWAMVKGYHAGQSFPTAGLTAATHALGHPPATWREFVRGYLSTIKDPDTHARHAHALDNATQAGAGSGLSWLQESVA